MEEPKNPIEAADAQALKEEYDRQVDVLVDRVLEKVEPLIDKLVNDCVAQALQSLKPKKKATGGSRKKAKKKIR